MTICKVPERTPATNLHVDPGMASACSVDAHLAHGGNQDRDRRIIEFLLSPLSRRLQEAGGER